MKYDRRPQTYRLRAIVALIREGMKSGSLASASTCARALEVSWRTIMRDLDQLRDDEGAPIVYDASRKGYYLEDAGWLLKPVTLNQREVFAFSVASRMLQPFKGTPLEMDLRSLFDKIARSLEGTVTLAADALTDRISLVSEDYVPLNRERWVECAGYINRREAIRMRYQKFSGESKTHDLSPVHLAAYHGNWYVLAFGRGREEPATFALSRIRSIHSLNDPGWAPPGFDVAHYLRTAFGITQGEKELDVHLRVSKKIATYVGERVWHPSQRLKKRKDGGLDLFIRTRGWKELVRWVLSWQPDMEVVTPLDLRKRVAQKLREGARLFPGQAGS